MSDNEKGIRKMADYIAVNIQHLDYGYRLTEIVREINRSRFGKDGWHKAEGVQTITERAPWGVNMETLDYDNELLRLITALTRYYGGIHNAFLAQSFSSTFERSTLWHKEGCPHDEWRSTSTATSSYKTYHILRLLIYVSKDKRGRNRLTDTRLHVIASELEKRYPQLKDDSYKAEIKGLGLKVTKYKNGKLILKGLSQEQFTEMQRIKTLARL